MARAEITGGSEVTKMAEIMSWTFPVCVILFSVLLCVFLLCVSFFSCVSFSSMCPYSLVYLKFLSSLGCVLLSVCLYTRVVFQCLVRCLKCLLDELFENLASQLIKSYHILSYNIISLLDEATKNVNRFTSSRAAPSTSEFVIILIIDFTHLVYFN